MSRSQFQSKRFILRHAWLNLWDERMTTGRINQVAILTTTNTIKQHNVFGTALARSTPHVTSHTIESAKVIHNKHSNSDTREDTWHASELPKRHAIKQSIGPAEANLNVPKSPELTTKHLLSTKTIVDAKRTLWTTRPLDCVVKPVRPKQVQTCRYQTNQAPHKSIKGYRYAKRNNKPTSCLGPVKQTNSAMIH